MTTATILLIDDAPHFREVLRVIEAADGRGGVALSREHRPAESRCWCMSRFMV